MVESLQKKLKLSDEVVNTLRLYEVHNFRIYRELTSDTSVAAFNDFVTIYAEPIPQEEQEADPETDRAVYAYHFDKEPNKMHGVPFKFIVKGVSYSICVLSLGTILTTGRAKLSKKPENAYRSAQASRARTLKKSNSQSSPARTFRDRSTCKMVSPVISQCSSHLFGLES